MAEQTEAPPELEIQFKTRIFLVKMPSPEQLLVWRRTLRQLQNVDADKWNAEQVMRSLERARSIVDSVLVNSMDVEWLDDEMLAGRVGLEGVVEIIQSTVEKFAEVAEAEGNRETRRAAKKTPTKKATRKKAS